jgi:AcrR family transcriptional regulator
MTKVSKKFTDPRVARTRKMLRSALFALLEEKHFDAITVLEITERAELNAATFYLHYDDKWDLLNSVVKEIDAIIPQLPQLAFTVDNTQQMEALSLDLKILEHVEQYRDFYRLMLGKHGVASVRDALQQQFLKILHVVLNHFPDTPDMPDIPRELVEHFFAGAYMGVIQWWLASKEPITAQQVALWIWSFEQAPPYRELIALATASAGEGVKG